MKIAIAGPASPGDLADYLDGSSAERARGMAGLGGPPVVGLAKQLVDRGHEVTVVTLSPGFKGDAELVGANLVVRVGPFRTGHRARDAFRVERRYVAEALVGSKAEVIHAHWTYEYALGALATGRPALITAHDAPLYVLWCHRDAYRLVRTGMAMMVARRARWMTAVCPYAAEHFRAVLGARCPIEVVPNGLSDEVFRYVASSGRPGDQVTIATVLNGFDRRKNGRRAMEALALVRRECPGTRLLMVGSGFEAEGPAAAWARGAGVAEGVEFAGMLTHDEVLRRLAAEAGILLHPALEESHSLVLCEAQALGIPIVAGLRAGGVPWTVEDGVTALLVDVRSAAAMARAIAGLIHDPQWRAAMGAAGRESARRRFGIAGMVASYERLYQRAAG